MPTSYIITGKHTFILLIGDLT